MLPFLCLLAQYQTQEHVHTLAYLSMSELMNALSMHLNGFDVIIFLVPCSPLQTQVNTECPRHDVYAGYVVRKH